MAADKRNVLIAGVTSSIGRQLALHLYNDKRVGVVFGAAQEERPYYFRDLDPERFVYKQLNILKKRELRNLFLSRRFKTSRINTVIHLAFNNRPIRGEDIHALNVLGTKALIEQCLKTKGINKFIFKSSDVVYKLRPHNPILLDENADLNFDTGADQWIKDRVDADMICRSYMDDKRINIVVLRVSNIIGRNISGQLNSYFDSKLVFKTLGFNPMINLIHMKDVIQSLRLAIFKAKVRGIFNIGGNDTAPITTFAELNGSSCVSMPAPLLGPINRLQRTLGMTDYYYSVDADRMKYSCLLDTAKARKVLGFNPTGRVEFS
ncbi:MAG: NAD-dependent epimerase/dehydratase family protein [Candidatus Alcyoniella australis]|nr:NAD-dependent epimerase/dehydratase family protein [Candidatus Alcyoniella australis]